MWMCVGVWVDVCGCVGGCVWVCACVEVRVKALIREQLKQENQFTQY